MTDQAVPGAAPRPAMLAVIAAGQSLATGGGARQVPPGARAVSTVPPDPEHLFMLDTGTLTGSLHPIDPAAITALVPIREDAGKGESQGTALLRLLGRGEIGGAGRDWVYLNHGVAGQAMAALTGEAVPQRNGLVQLRAAVALAAARGQRLRVVATTWSHGEADRKEAERALRRGRGAAPTMRSDYRDDLIHHAAASAAAWCAITGQAEPPWLLADQLAASTNGVGPSPIALAQGDAMTAAPRIALSCPRYFLRPPFGYLDAVHLWPTGYAVLGEYHAKAVARLLAAEAAGGDMTLAGAEPCLRPDLPSIRREGAVIHVPLRGARGEVVLDTATLPPARDFGFEWAPASGAGGIAAVRVADGAILIELTEAGPGRLTYGMSVQPERAPLMSCAWGNVRDNDPAESLAVPGLRLHNWLILFDSAVG